MGGIKGVGREIVGACPVVKLGANIAWRFDKMEGKWEDETWVEVDEGSEGSENGRERI